MHVFHTAGVPPSSGSSIFAIIGWIEKRSAELTKIVTPNNSVFAPSLLVRVLLFIVVN